MRYIVDTVATNVNQLDFGCMVSTNRMQVETCTGVQICCDENKLLYSRLMADNGVKLKGVGIKVGTCTNFSTYLPDMYSYIYLLNYQFDRI